MSSGRWQFQVGVGVQVGRLHQVAELCISLENRDISLSLPRYNDQNQKMTFFTNCSNKFQK